MDITIVLGIFVGFLAIGLAYLAVLLWREREDADSTRTTMITEVARHGLELTNMEKRHGQEQTGQEAKHSEAMRKQLIILRDEQNDLKHKFEAGLEEEQTKYSKLFSKHKSQQVRMGHVMEKIAPILKNFPVDITNASVIPLFDTVDYLVLIVGNPDESKDGIYFIEIKTGNGDLSTRQRKVRNLVRQNRVHFITHKADRMDEPTDES